LVNFLAGDRAHGHENILEFPKAKFAVEVAVVASDHELSIGKRARDSQVIESRNKVALGKFLEVAVRSEQLKRSLNSEIRPTDKHTSVNLKFTQDSDDLPDHVLVKSVHQVQSLAVSVMV